jgi:MurNAc alpha-1-phosphate uridylyltransferase
MQTAMILAAGKGERLRPLTESCPKALIKVQGMELIVYHLEALARANIKKVIINLCYLGHQIKETLGDGQRFGLEIQYSHESVLLETAGGVINALPRLGKDPFLVINADVYTDYPFWRLQLPSNHLAHLVLLKNPDWHTGDFDLTAGGLICTNTEQRPYTYSGIGIYHPDFFHQAPVKPTPMRPFFLEASQTNQLSGEVYCGMWSDVGTVERLRNLEQHLQNHSIPKILRNA